MYCHEPYMKSWVMDWYLLISCLFLENFLIEPMLEGNILKLTPEFLAISFKQFLAILVL